jgi:hypothetical protein
MALLVITGLSGGVALLVLSFRWGVALILNPDALPPLQSSLLSPFAARPLTTTTTQTDLEKALAETNRSLGTPLPITTVDDEKLWVFPILAGDSSTITELAILRRDLDAAGQEHLTSLSSLKVYEFDREVMLAPLQRHGQRSKVQPKGFLPTRIVALPTPPGTANQQWFSLTGQWQHQSTTLHYGQILYFNPDRHTLEPVTLWSSPAQPLPQWADLDGEGPLDLLIDQTLGMEPSLQGLQVRSQQGMGPAMTVQPIDWLGVPVDAGALANRYQQALRLARNGLWQAGHGTLATIQPSLANQWNARAEAQLRLMQRHAALAQQQADQNWSIPTQQILAGLIDSRWEAALTQLEADPELLAPLMRRLAADQDQNIIWNRILAATSLAEPDPAVYVWGGLTLKAQQNEQAALGWLTRQAAPEVALKRYQATLTLSPEQVATAPDTPTDPDSTDESAPSTATATATAATEKIRGLIGHAIPITNPDFAQWYMPDGAEASPALTQWYRIEIAAMRTGQGWQNASPSPWSHRSSPELWSMLPTASQPSLQMLHWTTASQGLPAPLTLQGLSTDHRAPQLLGSGGATHDGELPPLVYSNGALVWLDANQHATPAVNQVAGPIVQHLLYHQGPLAQDIGFALTALLDQVKLHNMDLTGDGHLEQILTFEEATLDQLQTLGVRPDRSSHKTVILSHDNQLLYSDLFLPQTLIALTNPQDGYPLSLLVLQADHYRLRAWAEDLQRFE